jgi:hydrogenase expression/formation protein HypC
MCLGIPGKIIDIYDNDGMEMGKIDFGGTHREVCLTYVPEAKIGDYALVHVGFAISLLNEEEANESLEALSELFNIQDEMEQPN